MIKNSDAFVKCFSDWCDRHNRDRSYANIEEFNRWATKQFDLSWDQEGNIVFGDPTEEMMFILRWA